MVEIPPLPGSEIVEPPKKIPVVRVSNVNKVYARLDAFTPEQKVDLYLWLAEQPIPQVDPVNLALASFNALKEEELPLYFEGLRKSFDSEVWNILTGEI